MIVEHLVILLIIVGVIDVVISTIFHFRNLKNDDLGKQFLETTKAFNQEKEQFRTQLEIKDTIIAALRDKLELDIKPAIEEILDKFVDVLKTPIPLDDENE